jgi:ABC-type bacteriocin/lantibiotic exporter with double-glycine peptidase domain
LKREQAWQQGRACGANSLYFMLRLNGKKVGLDELRRSLAPTERGNSLKDLRDAALARGLRTEVVQTDPDGFRGLTPPFIVHLSQQFSDYGHICLVLGKKDGYIHMIDGTRMIVLRKKEADFFKMWSGYALIAEETAMETCLRALLIIQALVLALFLGRSLVAGRGARLEMVGGRAR